MAVDAMSSPRCVGFLLSCVTKSDSVANAIIVKWCVLRIATSLSWARIVN